MKQILEKARSSQLEPAPLTASGPGHGEREAGDAGR